MPEAPDTQFPGDNTATVEDLSTPADQALQLAESVYTINGRRRVIQVTREARIDLGRWICECREFAHSPVQICRHLVQYLRYDMPEFERMFLPEWGEGFPVIRNIRQFLTDEGLALVEAGRRTDEAGEPMLEPERSALGAAEPATDPTLTDIEVDGDDGTPVDAVNPASRLPVNALVGEAAREMISRDLIPTLLCLVDILNATLPPCDNRLCSTLYPRLTSVHRDSISAVGSLVTDFYSSPIPQRQRGHNHRQAIRLPDFEDGRIVPEWLLAKLDELQRDD